MEVEVIESPTRFHLHGVGGVVEGGQYAEVGLRLMNEMWQAVNRLANEVARLREHAAGGQIVLLDCETNGDVDDPSSPPSHAALVGCYLDGRCPSESEGGE